MMSAFPYALTQLYWTSVKVYVDSAVVLYRNQRGLPLVDLLFFIVRLPSYCYLDSCILLLFRALSLFDAFPPFKSSKSSLQFAEALKVIKYHNNLHCCISFTDLYVGLKWTKTLGLHLLWPPADCQRLVSLNQLAWQHLPTGSCSSAAPVLCLPGSFQQPSTCLASSSHFCLQTSGKRLTSSAGLPCRETS